MQPGAPPASGLRLADLCGSGRRRRGSRRAVRAGRRSVPTPDVRRGPARDEAAAAGRRRIAPWHGPWSWCTAPGTGLVLRAGAALLEAAGIGGRPRPARPRRRSGATERPGRWRGGGRRPASALVTAPAAPATASSFWGLLRERADHPGRAPPGGRSPHPLPLHRRHRGGVPCPGRRDAEPEPRGRPDTRRAGVPRRRHHRRAARPEETISASTTSATRRPSPGHDPHRAPADGDLQSPTRVR